MFRLYVRYSIIYPVVLLSHLRDGQKYSIRIDWRVKIRAQSVAVRLAVDVCEKFVCDQNTRES
jgi:hypothetical protein